jgi:predicted nucleic acid-binding protein
MRLARQRLYQPKWTDNIHEEWISNLIKERDDLSRDKLHRTRDLMNLHAGDCLVEEYEPLIETLTLPDPDDRHVLAAAIQSEAEAIITFNLKDFPKDNLDPYGIRPIHPDEFAMELFDMDPQRFLAAVRAQRQGLTNPGYSPVELTERFRKNDLKQVADALTPYLDEI